MKKHLIIFFLIWFFVTSLLVINAKAADNNCQSKMTSCVENCQQKYPVTEPTLRVEPGDMNKTTKAQQFEAKKNRKECLNSCKIEKRICKAN